jgi:hypothetical protein
MGGHCLKVGGGTNLSFPGTSNFEAVPYKPSFPAGLAWLSFARRT